MNKEKNKDKDSLKINGDLDSVLGASVRKSYDEMTENEKIALKAFKNVQEKKKRS